VWLDADPNAGGEVPSLNGRIFCKALRLGQLPVTSQQFTKRLFHSDSHFAHWTPLLKSTLFAVHLSTAPTSPTEHAVFHNPQEVVVRPRALLGQG